MRILLLPLIAILLLLCLPACSPASANLSGEEAAPLTANPLQLMVFSDAPSQSDTPAQTQRANECLVCHGDKEQLIATARPIEAGVNESKGTG